MRFIRLSHLSHLKLPKLKVILWSRSSCGEGHADILRDMVIREAVGRRAKQVNNQFANSAFACSTLKPDL